MLPRQTLLQIKDFFSSFKDIFFMNKKRDLPDFIAIIKKITNNLMIAK